MGWVVSATPQPIYLRERRGTHCIWGWVGPRTGLDSNSSRGSGSSNQFVVFTCTQEGHEHTHTPVILTLWAAGAQVTAKFVLRAPSGHLTLSKVLLFKPGLGLLCYRQIFLSSWITVNSFSFFPHTYSAASWYYQSFFYSPTDAQVNCLKNNLKFTLKF
jgi:hypothetical protein